MSDHEHAVAVSETSGISRLRQWLAGKTATQMGGLLAIFIIWEILFRAEITSELLFPSIIDVPAIIIPALGASLSAYALGHWIDGNKSGA